MAAGLASQCAFYLSFVAVGGSILLYVAPLLFGIYIVAFWAPFNVLFLRHTSRGNRGEVIGIVFLVFPVVSIFAPILGGALISWQGYWLAFACACASIVAGMVMIVVGPTSAEPLAPRISFREMGGRLSAAFLGEGGQEGVWFASNALLAMTFAREEIYVGLLFSAFAVAGGVATVYLGRRSDRRGDRVFYARAGAALAVPALIAASFAPEALSYALAMAAANFALTTCAIFIFAMGTDRMERDAPSSVLTRELLLNAGRIVGGAACACAFVLSGDVRVAFAVSAPFIAVAILAK
jgi:MFS family permease